MSHEDFFKNEAKKFLKDWRTQTQTAGSDGKISYHYESKFYNVEALFEAQNWDDKDRQQIILARAQHLIAQITGFKNWPALSNATEIELEKAEQLLRSLKEKNELTQLISESDKKQFNPCFRIRCLFELPLREKKLFKNEFETILTTIKKSIKDTEFWIDFFDRWDTVDVNGREYTYFERRDYLKKRLKNKKQGYAKIITKAYQLFNDGKLYIGCSCPVVIASFIEQLGIRVFRVKLSHNKIAGFCSRFMESDFNSEIQEPVIVINETHCNTPEKFLRELAKQLYYMIAKDDEFDFADDIIKFEMSSTQNEAEKFADELFIPLDYLNAFLKQEEPYSQRFYPALTRDQKSFFLKNYEFEHIINRIKSVFYVDYRTAIRKILESEWEYSMMFDNYEEAEAFYLECLKRHDEQYATKIKYLNGEPQPLPWEEVSYDAGKRYKN